MMYIIYQSHLIETIYMARRNRTTTRLMTVLLIALKRDTKIIDGDEQCSRWKLTIANRQAEIFICSTTFALTEGRQLRLSITLLNGMLQDNK